MKDLWFGILDRGGSFIGYRLEPVTIEPLKTSGLAITGEFANYDDVMIRVCGEIQMIGKGYHVHFLTIPFGKENFV